MSGEREGGKVRVSHRVPTFKPMTKPSEESERSEPSERAIQPLINIVPLSHKGDSRASCPGKFVATEASSGP